MIFQKQLGTSSSQLTKKNQVWLDTLRMIPGIFAQDFSTSLAAPTKISVDTSPRSRGVMAI